MEGLSLKQLMAITAFKSSTQAGIALANAGGTHAEIVHQCVYDEVIGHQPCEAEDPALRNADRPKIARKARLIVVSWFRRWQSSHNRPYCHLLESRVEWRNQ